MYPLSPQGVSEDVLSSTESTAKEGSATEGEQDPTVPEEKLWAAVESAKRSATGNRSHYGKIDSSIPLLHSRAY